ncbi:MAG: SDR family oxidoreductase [Sulfuricaulis sp.]|nr:SDR family oxidoreductase [Sulfuricaulis sp.]
MDLKLTGKVAVVTGGSRGIGKAIAHALAHEGVNVALIARDGVAGQQAAHEIAAATGREIRAYQADTSLNDTIEAAVGQIARDFGGIDILVNCAAQAGGQRPPPAFPDITEEDFHADMNVKVMGYLRCAQAVFPHLKQRGWGRIINISGLAARQTGAIIGSIRNVGVAALTKNLADQLGRYGINVTCVHPGLTRTEKTREVVERQANIAGITSDEMEKRLASRNIVGRVIDASEVADLVVFLASPRSIAVNGDAIAAGGGTPGPIHY